MDSGKTSFFKSSIFRPYNIDELNLYSFKNHLRVHFVSDLKMTGKNDQSLNWIDCFFVWAQTKHNFSAVITYTKEKRNSRTFILSIMIHIWCVCMCVFFSTQSFDVASLAIVLKEIVALIGNMFLENYSNWKKWRKTA